MKYRILISSINGPLGYELVTYLKKSFYIIGCDKQPYGLGKMICDEFYICPDGSKKKYLQFLDKMSSKVDQFFLFSDEEILNLSRNKNRYKNVYSKTLMSQSKTIELCNNKIKMKKFLRNDINFPRDKGKNLIVKPIIGRGSKNQIIIKNKISSNIKKIISNNKNYFIEEYVDGKEYTIDCVYDYSHKLIFALPRERIIKSNLSIVGKIIKNNKIIEYVNKISKYLNFVGNVNIQVIVNNKNKIFLTDINPRISGSIIFSIKSGFNPFIFSKNILQRKKINKLKNIKYGKIYYRYWKTFKE